MLPSNDLLNVRTAPFLVPDRAELLIDYEWGGVDLNDTSLGLNHQIWTSNYQNDDVILSAGAIKHIIFTAPNLIALSFAFDFNMQPIMTYVIKDIGTYLRWYDALNNEWINEYLGEEYRTPQLSLDDFRQSQRNNADVIFAYVKNGLLCIRLQRDRFAIEYPLQTSSELYQIGMMQNYRFGFSSKAINSFVIQDDILLVNERNRTGRFDYFDLCPLQQSYGLSFGDNVRHAEGLAGNRYDKGFERAKNAVNLSFNLKKDDYDYFMAFYRVWQHKRKPFLVDLILDGRQLQTYKAHFALGSVSMSYVGIHYSVNASLVVLDNTLDKANIKQIAESRNV